MHQAITNLMVPETAEVIQEHCKWTTNIKGPQRSGVLPLGWHYGPSAGMEEALAMTRRLKAELPAMLAEHGQIVEALQKLEAAARAAGLPKYEEFAASLKLHAQTEEQVLYPAASLVGDYLALALPQGVSGQTASAGTS